MDDNQAVTVIETISNFYQSYTVTEDRVKEWIEFLKEYEFEFVMNNLKEYIKVGTYPPTIKDLVQEKAASKNIAYTSFNIEVLKERERQARELLHKYGVPDIDTTNVEIPDFLKGRKRGERKNGITDTR